MVEREAAVLAASASRDAYAQAAIALGDIAATAGVVVDDVAAARRNVEEQLAAIDEERRVLAVALGALEAVRRDADRARQARDAAAAEVTRRADVSRRAAQALQTLETRLESLQRETKRLSTALDQHLLPLFEWRLEVDPTARLRTLLDEWLTRRRVLDQADQSLPGLRQIVQTTEIGKIRAADAAEQAQRAADQAEARHGSLAEERSTLLSGEASDTAVARLDAAVSAAESVADRVRSDAEASQLALVTVVARVDACAQQADAAAALAEQQSGELADRLALHQLSEVEIAAEARAPDGALDNEARVLSELDERVTSAASAAATRAEDLRAHCDSSVPTMTAEDLALASAETIARESAASEVTAEAEAVIRQDDRARAQTTTIRQMLEKAREAAQIWFRLDELIGDREGRKFRRFAQGLTLDRLVFYANARLTELKPRYSLERRQDGEMLIQVVDNDLGGEVRGLHNLSGGERFLVSLALALGLSEMSTGQGLSIESLFIDEGFGALDSASLGQAISMLEGLHASGRRVGVISHIEEVKERIPVKIVVSPVVRGRSEITVESD
jgi:exonuclease SbcC